MSHTMTVEDAATHLAEVVRALRPGDEVVLTADNRPVARLVGQTISALPRRPGNCEGMLTILSDDADHLADFRDYMP